MDPDLSTEIPRKEPPRKQRRQPEQPQQTDSNKPSDEANRPEDSHPPVAGSSKTDGRSQATSRHDGVDMLKRPPPPEARGSNSGNRRPPQGRSGQPRDEEGRQPLGDGSPERSERMGSQDVARRGGQQARPAQQNLIESGRSNPPPSRVPTQASRIRPDGQGTGHNDPKAGKCDGNNCDCHQRVIDLERRLAEITQIVNGRSRADNTRQNALRGGSHPREQARREPTRQGNQVIVNRDQRAEGESRWEEKDPKLSAERPMTVQEREAKLAGNSDVTARGSAPMRARAGLQAAQRARQSGVVDNGFNQPKTRRPAPTANARAPNHQSAVPQDSYGLD